MYSINPKVFWLSVKQKWQEDKERFTQCFYLKLVQQGVIIGHMSWLSPSTREKVSLFFFSSSKLYTEVLKKSYSPRDWDSKHVLQYALNPDLGTEEIVVCLWGRHTWFCFGLISQSGITTESVEESIQGAKFRFTLPTRPSLWDRKSF